MWNNSTMRWVNILKTGGSIVSGLFTAVSFILNGLNITQIFGMKFNWSWWALGGFLVFIILMSWRIFDLQRQNKEKPTIEELKCIKENDSYYLEMKNKGGVGNFSAQIKVLEDNNNRLTGSTLVGYWVLGKNHDESEIKHDHVDRIKIGHLEIDNGVLVGISLDHCITPSNNRLASLSLRWTKPQINQSYKDIPSRFSLIVLPQIYKLRIVISSKPDLDEGSFTKDFLWNSNAGLIEL